MNTAEARRLMEEMARHFPGSPQVSVSKEPPTDIYVCPDCNEPHRGMPFCCVGCGRNVAGQAPPPDPVLEIDADYRVLA